MCLQSSNHGAHKMKFTLKATIVTDKTGIDLNEEYERLGFIERSRPSKWVRKCVTIEVDAGFAKNNKDLFNGSVTAYVLIDSARTEPADWEDWGSAGAMPSRDNLDLRRVMSISTPRPALK